MAEDGPESVGVELEHAVGFAGGVRDCVKWGKGGKALLWPTGAVVVVADPSDPHEQRFLRGHSEALTAVDLSSSKRFLATGQSGRDSDVVVWDLEKEAVVFRFEEHDDGVADVAFSQDERVLVSVGVPSDGQMVVWDLATGCIIARAVLRPTAVATVACGGMVLDVKRRPTGLYQVATAGSGGICVWSINPISGMCYPTNVRLSAAMAERDFACVDFAPSCRLLAAGTTAGELVLVDVIKRSLWHVMPVAGGGVGAVRWLSDDVIACGSREGQLVVIDLTARGEPSPVMRQRVGVGGVTSLSFSPERVSLAVGCDDGRLVEAPLPPVVAALLPAEGASSGRGAGAAAAEHGASPKAAVVLQDGHGTAGKRFGEGVSARGSGGAAVSSKAGSTGLLNTLPGPVLCASFAPEVSDAFVTGGADCTVRQWSAEDYTVVSATREREAGVPVCCSQSLDLLTVGWEDGTLRGYSGETMESLFTVPRAHSADAGGTTAVGVSGNERFVMSGGGDGCVRVWELRSREMIADLRGHAARVAAVEVFADDVHAITVSRDRTMVCWDLRRERRVSSHSQRLGGISALALSDDQSIVITGGLSKSITLWDLREPQPVQAIAGAHGEAEITTLASLGDRDMLASGGADGSIRLWDMRTCKQVSDCIAHSDRVNGLSVAGDRRQMVSVGSDGCVMIWNLFGLTAHAEDDRDADLGAAADRAAGD